MLGEYQTQVIGP